MGPIYDDIPAYLDPWISLDLNGQLNLDAGPEIRTLWITLPEVLRNCAAEGKVAVE